jgi:hypothetical protein
MVTLEDVVGALHRVPNERLPDILQFIEFIKYQAFSEDELLWAEVEAEQAYRQKHPEDVIIYSSIEELAAALDQDE